MAQHVAPRVAGEQLRERCGVGAQRDGGAGEQDDGDGGAERHLGDARHGEDGADARQVLEHRDERDGGGGARRRAAGGGEPAGCALGGEAAGQEQQRDRRLRRHAPGGGEAGVGIVDDQLVEARVETPQVAAEARGGGYGRQGGRGHARPGRRTARAGGEGRRGEHGEGQGGVELHRGALGAGAHHRLRPRHPAGNDDERHRERAGRHDRAGASHPCARGHGRTVHSSVPRASGDPFHSLHCALPSALLGLRTGPSRAPIPPAVSCSVIAVSGQALQRTPLHGRHVALGAKTGAFAGWDMPLSYTTPRAEHHAVRDRLGVFDVSHMGQLEVSGPGAEEALASVLTNDLGRIGVGGGQYTLMCHDDGGVIDDLIVYRLQDRFLLVVNASNVLACVGRLEERLPAQVEWADRTWEVAMLALQGRAWAKALLPLADGAPLTDLDYFAVMEAQVAGVPCLVARTGYTGEPGVEIMCPWDSATTVWDALMDGGEPPAPAGLVARDTLRLEMGYPLYGQELGPDRTPIEAGLKWACNLKNGRFAGADVLRRRAEEGPSERLVMIRLTERGIPRQGQAVLDAEGRPAGVVTSGTLSPVLDEGIGMAYVRADLAQPGTPVAVDIRGTVKQAVTARRPLVETSPKEE